MPQYRNTPLTEAVINLQARLPDSITSDTVRTLRDGLEQEFPHSLELTNTRFELRLGEENPRGGVSHSRSAGWMFRSADEKRIVQSRLDGFAFARLAPYERWETFRDEARSFWNRYRGLAHPEAITAVGIKYINLFHIPLPIRDFKDFFRTTPEVSPMLPQAIAAFFMQLQIPYPESNAMLVLTHTLVPPPRAGIVSLVLDIDVTCSNNVPADDGAIWELLERFRMMKNDVFEACITDAARELIR